MRALWVVLCVHVVGVHDDLQRGSEELWMGDQVTAVDTV